MAIYSVSVKKTDELTDAQKRLDRYKEMNSKYIYWDGQTTVNANNITEAEQIAKKIFGAAYKMKTVTLVAED